MCSSNKIVNHHRRAFLRAINEQAADQNCLRNPKTDFSRYRKLNKMDVIRIPYRLTDKSLSSSLPKIFTSSPVVSAAAVSKARSKIRSDTYVNVFHCFNQTTKSSDSAKYKNHRLIAVDGSEINVLSHKDNPAAYARTKKGDYRNYYHLNAAFDTLNHVFIDAVVQPGSLKNEDQALLELSDSEFLDTDDILTCDRGYESLLTFHRLENKGMKYLIRIKDQTSAISLLKHYPTPDMEEYDIPFEVVLTCKNNKETKDNWDTYKYISHYRKEPEFQDGTTHIPLKCRVVRFRALSEGKQSLMTVCTNLSTEEFSTSDIKEIYRLRWQEEIGFRDLKHQIDLKQCHSRSEENIISEIYAKMTVYNLCSRIRNALDVRKRRKKHIHKLNFGYGISLIREYLFAGRLPGEFESWIKGHTEPERPGRADIRKKKKSQSEG